MKTDAIHRLVMDTDAKIPTRQGLATTTAWPVQKGQSLLTMPTQWTDAQIDRVCYLLNSHSFRLLVEADRED